MHIIETPRPCLVASCQKCGATSWPPCDTKGGAETAARKDWGFEVLLFDANGQRIEPLTLCAVCLEGELPA